MKGCTLPVCLDQEERHGGSWRGWWLLLRSCNLLFLLLLLLSGAC
jgi:hypothetical protein